MIRCLRFILLYILLDSFVKSTCAQPATNNRASDAFASAMDQMFAEFFGETQSERQLVNEVAVSREEEKQIGDAGLQDLLDSLRKQKIRVVDRGDDAGYLNSLVAEIHPLMRNAERYPAIRLYVAESKITDARAFPGGAIVCTTGLIDFARSEAALVGVLAHELSHIDRVHLLRTARGIKLAQDTSAVRNAPAGAFMRNGIMVAKQFARPFRSEDEAEADLDAAKWMFELGYDPLEMAALFRRFDQRSPADPVRMPGFLRTHPYHADRFEAVKQLSLRLQAGNPDTDLYVGRTNLQKRIPRRIKQFPN
jgi:predicted Zn-dependent protease